jgi:hypothetical protein
MPTVEHKLNFDNLVENVKNHVKRHQAIYSFGAGVGMMGLFAFATGGRYYKVPEIAIRPISVLSKQTVVAVIKREGRGHPGFPVWCRETGDAWFTQGEAAKSVGTSALKMSQHLNGHRPDVFGLHYERLNV